VSRPVVRDSVEADLDQIATIYAHHVTFGRGSFEEAPPSREELARRRADVLGRGLPYLVAEDSAGRLLGYCYAGPYRTRSAYRFTVENSVYVAPDAPRQGIGRLLLEALIDRCAAAGIRQMVAVIGDSQNTGSIGLHAALGFRRVGTLEAIGWKHGRWLDSVLMQRSLGPGDSSPPG
jgi:L-amino acid N-acyltransferase YncA